MRLILTAPDPLVHAAFSQHFATLPDVEIVNHGFEGIPTFDCIVSAANSFGLMDGGVDAAITEFFGVQLKERVQKRIWDLFLGEQPVGTSIIVETDHPKHPYLAHTPTMRVPMPVARTDHAYVAMWAMLNAVRLHNLQSTLAIEIIACPGLCTATGRMPAPEAARQMALAYRNFLEPPPHFGWQTAFSRQDSIGRGGDIAISLMNPDAKPSVP